MEKEVYAKKGKSPDRGSLWCRKNISTNRGSSLRRDSEVKEQDVRTFSTTIPDHTGLDTSHKI